MTNLVLQSQLFPGRGVCRVSRKEWLPWGSQIAQSRSCFYRRGPNVGTVYLVVSQNKGTLLYTPYTIILIIRPLILGSPHILGAPRWGL